MMTDPPRSDSGSRLADKPSTNAAANNPETTDLSYIFYLVDGAGLEFFITAQDTLVSVGEKSNQAPLEVHSFLQISTQLKRLRAYFPESCRIFALERSEFNARREKINSL